MVQVAFSFNADDFKRAYSGTTVSFDGYWVTPEGCVDQGIYIPYCECADISDLFDALTTPVTTAPGIVFKGDIAKTREEELRKRLVESGFNKDEVEDLISVWREKSKLDDYLTYLTQEGRDELLHRLESEDPALFKILRNKTTDEIRDYLFKKVENDVKTVRKALRKKFDLDEFFFGVVTDRPDSLLALADRYGAKGFCITAPPSVVRDLKFPKYNVDKYINSLVWGYVSKLRKSGRIFTDEVVKEERKKLEKKLAPYRNDRNISMARLDFMKKLEEFSYSDDELSLICFFPRKKQFYYDKFGRKKVRFVGPNEDFRKAVVDIALKNIHNSSEVPYYVIDFKCDGFKCTPENELTRGKGNVCEIFMPLRDNIARTQVLLKAYVSGKKSEYLDKYRQLEKTVEEKVAEKGMARGMEETYVLMERMENEKATLMSLYDLYDSLEKSDFYEDGLKVAEDFIRKVCK